MSKIVKDNFSKIIEDNFSKIFLKIIKDNLMVIINVI